MTAVLAPSRPAGDVDAPPRLVLRTVVVGVALLPVLRPIGPAQITPFDILGLLAIAAVTSWGSRPGGRIRLPYALPVAAMVGAGGIAALHGTDPSRSLVTLGQDLFLLAWCGVVATVAATRRGREVVVAAWVWTATAWATFALLAVSMGRPELAGAIEEYEGRIALFSGDPNLMGGYFLTSLFVLGASSRPAGRCVRTFVVIVLLTALALTGSNGSVLGLIVGSVLTAGLTRVRRGAVPLGVAVLAAGAVAIVAAIAVDRSGLTQAATSDSSGVLANTVGRTGDSANDRSLLLGENLALYRDSSVLGVGPGQAKAALSNRLASYTKEAHNDYVAALVERGVLGALALVALAFALTVTVARATAAPPDDIVSRPVALAGAAAAFAVAGLFYEVLHFRHFWAFAGLVAAIALTRGERK